MRKSSRGNPYHDERGRFTTADKCKKKVDYKGDRHYEVQTARCKCKLNPPPKVDAYVIENGEARTVYGDQVQKGMIVEQKTRAFPRLYRRRVKRDKTRQ